MRLPWNRREREIKAYWTAYWRDGPKREAANREFVAWMIANQQRIYDTPSPWVSLWLTAKAD